MAVQGDVGEYLIEVAKKMGVACATVSDGHVIILTREKIQEILAAAQDKGMVIVHIKRPDFNS
jgi:DUF1009 family protein